MVRSLCLLLFVGLCCALCSLPARAAIVTTGDVDPTDPATWTSLTWAYVGKTSDGSLVVDLGSRVASQYGYLGYNAGSSGTATVTGAGTKWNSTQKLYVGNTGIGTLNVEDGGWVSNMDGYLGYNAGSSGTATVTGAGAKWTSSQNFYVGYSGGGVLNIATGGEVSNTSTYLGYNAGSSGTATVTGAGAKWTSTQNFYVGCDGSGTLTVNDGGLVVAQTLFASLGGLAGNGTISARGVVLDADLVFDATHELQQTLAFGEEGALNIVLDGIGALGAGHKGSGSLKIADGITVASAVGYLGCFSGSSGTATITGASSTWINNGDLYIGNDGSGKLTVSDGGLVTAKTLFSSLGDVSGNGTISASGAVLDADVIFDATHGLQQTLAFGTGGALNLSFDGTGALGAGHKGSGTVTIADGVAVGCTYGYLGFKASSNGTATVTGAGSKWTSGLSLSVGQSGNGTLNIVAGGEVSSGSAYLGGDSGSNGTATVSGIGSRWINSNLSVGRSGNGTLNIDGGGEVSSTNSYLGYSAGSNGMATVSGDGSKWTASGDLYVGRYGSGGLKVSDGGLVTAKMLYASQRDLTGNGTISVRGAVLDADVVFDGTHGPQSIFGNGGALILNVDRTSVLGVGYKGCGNLRITDGVTVGGYTGFIGYNSGSRGTALVAGVGTTWTSIGDVYVGFNGDGDLRIEAGGQLSDQFGSLGRNLGSSGTATVSGSGSKWTNSWNLDIGHEGNGSLTIEAGGQVDNLVGVIGFLPGSSGTVTVKGTGSRWNSSHGLFVGERGTGTLNIMAGGAVNCDEGYIGRGFEGTGVVNVSGAGSTWTSSRRIQVGDLSPGILNINAGGAVNSTSALIGALSTGLVNVNGLGSQWNIANPLYVGSIGAGTLNVTSSGEVRNNNGYIGHSSGSTGAATVSGAASAWINRGSLNVGTLGSGSLRIEAGGSTSNTTACLGYYSSSSGTVMISGAGSRWTSSSSLTVGANGRGTVTLVDGGAVTAQSVSINSQSLWAIDVGNDSRLTVDNGTGTIVNNGKIRLLAGAGASAGVVYTPISASNYGDASNYQAVGGIWDATVHTFIPSAVEETAAGMAMTLDLTVKQRAKIGDGATGWSLGESFLAKSASLTVTTTAIGGATRTALEPRIASDQSLRGGWQFATDSGYAAGEPVYLSFDLGAGYSRSALSVWRYDGTAWESSDAFDLTYDGRYASFTVTDLDTAGYAMAGTLARAWGGGADGDDWSQGTNWNNAVGFMPTDVVRFDGTTRLTPNNDLENQQVGGLTFAAGAGAFHLGGNALKVAGKIDDQAAAGQEINLPVEFVAGPESGTVNVVEGRQLTMSQLVSGDQGLRKTGPGLLELIQDAAYSGDTLVEAGVLKMAGLSNSDSTTVGSATTTAELITSYIHQDTLTIHAGSKVTLSSTDWATPAGGFTSFGVDPNARAVPEPASWALLMLALLGGYVARIQNR